MVIVLLPVCSWIEDTDQLAFQVVPDSDAVPLPPLSLDQRTWYRRMLSMAVPFIPMRPLEPPSITDRMLTVGAVESMAFQRQRCAVWMSALSSGASPSCNVVDDVSFAPPQLAKPKHASACATARAVLFNRIFIPNAL